MYIKKSFLVLLTLLITNWCAAMQHQQQTEQVFHEKIMVTLGCNHTIPLEHWHGNCTTCHTPQSVKTIERYRKNEGGTITKTTLLVPDEYHTSISPDRQKRVHIFSEDFFGFWNDLAFIVKNGKSLLLNNACGHDHKWSPDSKFLLTQVHLGGHVQLYSAETGALIREFDEVWDGLDCVNCSTDGRYLFVHDLHDITTTYEIRRSPDDEQVKLRLIRQEVLH